MQSEVRKLLMLNKRPRIIPVDFDQFCDICNCRMNHVKPGYEATWYEKYVIALSALSHGTRLPNTLSALLGISPCSNTSVQFYVDRGWSALEAKAKITHRQRTLSVNSIMRKHGVTHEQAVAIQAARITLRTASSIANAGGVQAHKQKRGDTMRQVAVDAASKWGVANGVTVDLNAKYRAYLADRKKQKINSGELIPAPSTTMIQYYINQGLTVDQAIQARRNRQRTFSLDKCIARYGQDIGRQVWKDRQSKWLATMNAKSPEELLRIRQSKIEKSAFVSQASINFFKVVTESTAADLLIYHGESEYFINDGCKFWLYDFCIPSLNLIVEYNGQHVHPREDSPETWVHAFTKESKQDRLDHDQRKHLAATSRGFDVMYVWHDQNIASQQQMIIDEIQQRIIKKNT